MIILRFDYFDEYGMTMRLVTPDEENEDSIRFGFSHEAIHMSVDVVAKRVASCIWI